MYKPTHWKYSVYLARHTELRNILTKHHWIHMTHWNILHNPLIHISHLEQHTWQM